MKNESTLRQLYFELEVALVKIREADKNEKACLAMNDFNTAAYWTQKEREAWDEYTKLVIEINKLGEDPA